jgi:hypothetical protein
VNNLIITASLLMICGFLAIFSLVFFRLFRYFQDVWSQIIDFLTPQGENQQSGLGKLIDAAGYTMGHAAAVEIKTTLLNAKSQVSKAVEGEVLDQTGQVLAANQPVLGAAFQGLNARSKKSILNNPLAQLVISQLLNGQGLKIPGGGNHHQGSSTNSSMKMDM